MADEKLSANVWREWAKHAANEIATQKVEHKELRKEVQAIKLELAVTKSETRLKFAVLGTIGGIIITVGAALLKGWLT